VANIPETGDLNRSTLRVRYLRHQETVPSLKSAAAYCREIIRQEPNCAAAYAELVLTLFLLEKLGAVSRECVEPTVRHAVDRALCLDERASLSLICRAKQEYRYDWNWDAAERHFQAALEADPDDADAFSEVTIMFLVMRRFDDALIHVRRACQLDPLSPAACLQLAHTSYAMGQWQTAARHYRRLLQYSPEHVFAYWGLAETLTRSGNPSEAIVALTQGLAIPGNAQNPFLLASLSRSKAAGGSGVRLGTMFEEFPREISDLVLSAELCGSLGQPAKAFALLDEAADMRHYRLGAINIFPQCGPLWEDPRYHRFLRRIGLAS